MAKKNIKLGLFLIMLLALAMSVFATPTINGLDFPDKIGTAYSGMGIADISSTTENDLLIKTEYLKNGNITQQNSYIDGSAKYQIDYTYSSTLTVTTANAMRFKDYYLSSGKDDVTPGDNQPRIWDLEGNVVHEMDELAGLVCYASAYDEPEDTLWIGCTSAAKALWKINATSFDVIQIYNSTNSGLFVNGVNNDIQIFGDLLWVGQSNAGRLLNKTNPAVTIEAFTTNCGFRGWFDEDLNKLYATCGIALWEYDIATDTKVNHYNVTADPFLGSIVIPYSFSNDERLLIINYDTVLGDQSVSVYNKSNMSQGVLERKTYPKHLGNYQYQYRVNDPNMFWSTLIATEGGIYYARGIDRDLDMALFPSSGGTRQMMFVDLEANEWWVTGSTSGPFLINNLYNKATPGNEIFTKKYTTGGLAAEDNLTLRVSVLDELTSEVTRYNDTAVVYNNSLTLTYPKIKSVIQRGLDNKSQLNIYGTYSGDAISSFNMTYDGTDSGTLNIPVSGGTFSKSINLSQGDYILKYLYNDIELANNYEFGIGDVIIVHGQSNAVNTHNAGKVVTESPYGVYKSIKSGAQTTACYALSYSVSDMETGNRWGELAHGASIEAGVPVMIHNFAVGGQSIAYINSSCYTYDIQTLTAETGNNLKVKGMYWYQGESDESNDATTYYNKLNSFSSKWFSGVDFVGGDLFVAGQVLSTPITPPAGNVRLAIQNAWYNIAGIERGSIMYDIRTNPEDTVHPYGDGKLVFDARNNEAALYAMYGLFTAPPVLQSAYMLNSSRLLLNFNKGNLEISTWDNVADTVFEGLRLNDLKLNESNISSVSLLTNKVIVDFNEEILSDGDNISLCDVELDCYNQPVLRESIGDVPAEIVWDMEVTNDPEYTCNFYFYTWFNEACYPDLQTACSSNGLLVSGDTCLDLTESTCKTISDQVYDSFNLGVIALIILVASLIIGLLMTSFGGQGFDAKMLTGTIAMVIIVAIMFVIGVVVFGYVTGAIC